MAKIVNKQEKRKEIALNCKELFLEKGMKVTVLALAQSAHVGKGTIYEYFKNKEDIIFEILNLLIEEFNKEFFVRLNSVNTAFEKLLIFAEFFYRDYKDLQKIYKEFLSINLTTSTQEMKEFATGNKEFYYKVLEDILKYGIAKKELKKKSLKYKRIIYTMCEGLFIESETTNLVGDKEREFKKELKAIYKLLKK